jgi:hypothetical protein
LFFEKFNALTTAPSGNVRDDLLHNMNYQSNIASFSFFRKSLSFLADDNADNFGYRVTGALCPTISGTYMFTMIDVDDYFEMRLMRDDQLSFDNVMSVQRGSTAIPNSTFYDMIAGHKYALVMLFVERGGNDYSLLHWTTPGATSPVPIPPDAFCSGWATMSGNVLQVYFTWPLMPNQEVTFTVVTVPNPAFPQLSSPAIPSAIQSRLFSPSDLVNSNVAVVSQSSEGFYPQIHPSMSLAMQTSSFISRTRNLILNVTIIPSFAVPLQSSIKVDLTTIGISLSPSSVVTFSLPLGAAGSINFSDLNLLDVSLNEGVFPSGHLINFKISYVSNPTDRTFLFRETSNILSYIISSDQRAVVSGNTGTFPYIKCGSATPLITLSSVVAGDAFVSMHVMFTAMDVSVPLQSSFMITLVGDGIACGGCTFSPRLISLITPHGAEALVKITALVMTIQLTAGSFPPGSDISFAVSGIRNPFFPQPFISSLKAGLLDPDGVLVCQNAQGTFPAISAGDISSVSAPKISLDNVIAGSNTVKMIVSLTPITLNVLNGSIVITLIGSGISLHAHAVLQFISPADGVGVVRMQSRSSLAHVLSVTLVSGSFAARDPVIFSIYPVSNPKKIQSPLNSLNVAITDAHGAAVNLGRSDRGLYPAIVDGSLGIPVFILSSVMANANVIARVSFDTSSSLPSHGKAIIKIPSPGGIVVPWTAVSFSSPDRGASGYIYSNQTDSSVCHLVLVWNSGVFPPAAHVSFSFGNFTNPADPQASIFNVEFSVYDAFDVLRAHAVNGFFPAITSGATVLGMPVLHLADNSMGARDVRMSIFISPFPVGSSIVIITIAGAALSCKDETGCVFAGPRLNDISAAVQVVQHGSFETIIRIEFPVPPLSSAHDHAASDVSIDIDGLMNPAYILLNVSDVRAAFIDKLGQVQGITTNGSFPSIVSLHSLFFKSSLA